MIAPRSPAPWSLHEAAANGLDVCDDEGEVVASINADEDLPDGPCRERSNGRLLAAAPALLVGLQHVSSTGHRFMSVESIGCGDCQRAAAAIVAAGGCDQETT